jgi:hypothetical protein
MKKLIKKIIKKYLRTIVSEILDEQMLTAVRGADLQL